METKLVPMKPEVVQALNASVLTVLSSDTIIGFEKAYIIADAIKQLKVLLTPEYMKPIMELQGSRLGFKTDKDKTGGYSEKEVRDCLIDAVLCGVQPFENQFNIITGQMYITKEGFGYLLSKIQGLNYEIIFDLPRINKQSDSAAIVAHITWSMNGAKKERKMDVPVKLNQYMGTDAVIGKATRKARAWLFSNITGTEFGEGDIEDAKIVTSSSKIGIEDLQFLLDSKRELATKEQIEDMERCIKGTEEKSFKKFYDLWSNL